MIETEIAFGALETFLDRPSKAGALGRENQIIGLLAGLLAVAPDQEPSLEAFFGRPGERHPRPVIKAQSFRALASRKPRPILGEPIRLGALGRAAYQLTRSATLDVSYRYLNSRTVNTIINPQTGMTVRENNWGQQIRVGVRYALQ